MSNCKKAHESPIRTLAFIEACGVSKTPEWKKVTNAIKKFLNNQGDEKKILDNAPENLQEILTNGGKKGVCAANQINDLQR